VDKRQRLHFGQFFVASLSEEKRCFILAWVQVNQLPSSRTFL